MNTPMSDTQEKLEQKIFNLVYQWGRVGIVADHTAPTYVAYIQELIESAKREAISEYIEPHLRACRDYNGREWCKNCGLRPLQEQSGGSDDI